MKRRKTMNRSYIEKQVRSGKWIPHTLPNGSEIYWAERSSRFIEEFTSKGDSFCPHFKVIGAASGCCAVQCRGCFLMGTFRVLRDPGKPILYTNLDKCAQELEKDIVLSKEPSVYNDGEKCDSLLYDEYHGVTRALLPVFVKYKDKGNRFLRLTKSANVKHLVGLDHHEVMIISYSLNPQIVADLFETYPQASIIERIQAASLAQNEGGYPSRVRIDPIIPVKTWEKIYSEFLERMAELNFRPERFTLGLYRVLKRCGHIDKILDTEFAVPLDQLQDADECNIQARLRIPLELRVEVYSFLIERIQDIFPESRIGVCKETNELRNRIGFTDNDTNCNCTS
jgi:DNA repair photolyase